MRIDHHVFHHRYAKDAEAWRHLLIALGDMNRKLETIMVDTSKVTADFDAFAAKIGAKVADMGKQIDDLKAAVAANDSAAAQAAIDALDAHVKDVANSLVPDAPAAP